MSTTPPSPAGSPADEPSGTSATPRPPRGSKPPGVDLRHQARIVALQILYEADMTEGRHGIDEVMARTFADTEDVMGRTFLEAEDDDQEPSPYIANPDLDDGMPAEQRQRITALVHGVADHDEEVDRLLAEAATAFPIAQLAVVDRNVLRLAIFELLHEPDVPTATVINEAVELGKRFGGEASGRFVNGVLGTIAGKVRGPREGYRPPPKGKGRR